MYDFEDEKPSGAVAAKPPHRALMFLEAPRFAGELAASHALDLFAPRRPSGEGRPVLVIPGFRANDRLTGRVRGHLMRHDFRVHGWKLGPNIGLTDPLIDGLVERFEDLHKQYDEPVSVVGWSFGGVLARWLAHTYPDDVRQIICLGSPWRAEGEKTHATAMFERARKKHGISDRARPMMELLRGPVPVPCTAVYSKSDGIVPWAGCAVDPAITPPAENVVVRSSHVGMVANPLVLDVVVDRLCQDPDDWQAFSWRSALSRKWSSKSLVQP